MAIAKPNVDEYEPTGRAIVIPLGPNSFFPSGLVHRTGVFAGAPGSTSTRNSCAGVVTRLFTSVETIGDPVPTTTE